MTPKVIDLFAGAGGLSLGAARAGFDVAGAVELDAEAIQTHHRNFPSTTHLASDVSHLTGRALLERIGVQDGELAGLIGGPPCQGFSSMGARQSSDLRNDLFAQFFRLVRETLPAFFVAENVPGVLHPRYAGTLRTAAAMLPVGYHVFPPIEVRADRYGAPTSRRRLMFIGYRPSKFSRELDAVDFNSVGAGVQRTNVARALAGLPTRIDARWQTEELGWRPVGAIGSGEFERRVTNAIPSGVGDPASLERCLGLRQVSGCLGTRHSELLRRRYAALSYGEKDPITKSIRLDPAGLCPTLRAGTGSDKGRFQAVRPIHHLRPRVITPREAARLQGFPDWFMLHRTKWHSFRQIGNSVSPLVAESVLQPLRDALR